MAGQLLAVQKDLRRHGRALKGQEAASILRHVRPGKMLAISGGAAPIIVAAILAVHRIPGMGQIDPFPIGGKNRRDLGGFAKTPIGVQIDRRSHGLYPPFYQKILYSIGTRNAVRMPATTRERLLTAPCTAPSSLALVVPITWEAVPMAVPWAMGS